MSKVFFVFRQKTIGVLFALLFICIFFVSGAEAGQTIIVDESVDHSVWGNGDSADNGYNPDLIADYPNEAIDNTVIIKRSVNGGVTVAGDVIGGGAGSAAGDAVASGNSVDVINGTNVNGAVVGGYVALSMAAGEQPYKGEATNNTVNISGNALGDVYGGYVNWLSGSGKYNKATGNTVTISRGANIAKDVYGGYIAQGINIGDGDAFSGNTLNLDSDSFIQSVNNFETINFGNMGTVDIGSLDTSPTGADVRALVKLNTADNNVLMNGEITGSGGIAKIGAGTLTLTGVNTYTGATTVSDGRLEIADYDSINADSMDITVSGANSELHSNNDIIIGDTGNGALTITDGGRVTAQGMIVIGNNSSGTVTVSGSGSALEATSIIEVGYLDSGVLNITDGAKVSARRVALEGGGGINSRGKILVGAGSELHSTSTSANLAINDGLLMGTGTVTSGKAVSIYDGTISAGDFAGQVGTLTISSDLVSGGMMHIVADTRKDGTADLIKVNGIFNNNNLLLIDIGSLHNVNNVTILESDSFVGSYNGANLLLNGGLITDSGRVTSNGIMLYFVGNKILLETNFTAQNEKMTWTGATNSTWNMKDSNWQNDWNSLHNFIPGDWAVFDSGAGSTITGNVYSSRMDVLAGEWTFSDDMFVSKDLWVGAISNSEVDGMLHIDNADVTLNGNNYFEGGIDVNNGTLSIASDNNVAGGANSMTDSTLVLTGSSYAKGWTLTGDNTIDTPNDTIYDGVLSGTGGIIKSGAGILNLSGENTYTGDTTIDVGTLLVTGSLGAGDYAGNIANNTELIFDQESDQALSGVIYGLGSISKYGTGTLTIMGPNDYVGDTGIYNGILSISSDANIGAGINTISGGTLQLVGGEYEKAWTLGAGGNAIDALEDTLLGGVLSGDGGFSKTGEGSLTLSGENSYTGNTIIDEGALIVTGILGDGNYTGNIGNNTELIFDQIDDQTISGFIAGSGVLIKDGIGNLTLAGNNSYEGDTVIDDGMLTVSGTLGGGSYAGAIHNSGELILEQTDNQLLSGGISGSGKLTKDGSGTLILDGVNTYTGDMNINDGTVLVTGVLGVPLARALVDGDYVGNIANKAELIFDQDSNQILSGIISGSGNMTKDGTGNLTLTGANNYTGDTTINGGTLALTGVGSIGSGALTLFSGSVFDFAGLSADSLAVSTLHVKSPGALINALGKTADFTNSNLYFYLPSPANADEVLLTVDGDTDMMGVTVNLDSSSGRSGLTEGEKIILLDVTGTLTSDYVTATVQTASGDIYMVLVDGNRLEAILEEISPTDPSYERIKAFAESRTAELAFINQGMDFILNKGMDSAVAVTAGSGLRMSAFSEMSGGRSKYNTGSHVDLEGVSLMAGFALGNDIADGRLTAAAFFESGWGDYDSYNSFNEVAAVHGKGDIAYTGGGLLGRYELTQGTLDGLYFEASARVGHAETDFRSDDIKYNTWIASFDSKSPYYGMHAGVGYTRELSYRATLNLSARLLWTHLEGDRLTVYSDDVRFEDADSLRTRMGGRFSYAVNGYLAPYAGLYWEHEFDGKLGSTVNSVRIDEPSLRGDSGMGELGLTITSDEDSGFTADVSVQGYVGERDGAAGNIRFGWRL